MKLSSKNSFVGSVIALLVGSSCCWLSTLAAWIGGISMISALVTLLEKTQIYLFGIAFILAILGFYFLYKNKQ